MQRRGLRFDASWGLETQNLQTSDWPSSNVHWLKIFLASHLKPLLIFSRYVSSFEGSLGNKQQNTSDRCVGIG